MSDVSVSSAVLSLPTNRQVEWNAGGRQIAFKEATGEFEVSFDRGSSWTPGARGIQYNIDHDGVLFRNRGPLPVTVEFIQSTDPSVFVDAREQGAIEVIGDVAARIADATKVSVGNVAVQLVAQNVLRRAVTVKAGVADLYLGGTAAVAVDEMGWKVPAETQWRLETSGAVYAIRAGAAVDAGVLEELKQ